MDNSYSDLHTCKVPYTVYLEFEQEQHRTVLSRCSYCHPYSISQRHHGYRAPAGVWEIKTRLHDHWFSVTLRSCDHACPKQASITFLICTQPQFIY